MRTLRVWKGSDDLRFVHRVLPQLAELESPRTAMETMRVMLPPHRARVVGYATVVAVDPDPAGGPTTDPAP